MDGLVGYWIIAVEEEEKEGEGGCGKEQRGLKSCGAKGKKVIGITGLDAMRKKGVSGGRGYGGYASCSCTSCFLLCPLAPVDGVFLCPVQG